LEKKGFFINKDGKDSRDLYKPAKAKNVEDEEMEEVEKKPAKAEKVEKVEKKKPEDDGAKPKKVTSAYFFFQNQNRPRLMKENPDMKITEVAKINGQAWSKPPKKRRNLSTRCKKKTKSASKRRPNS